MVGVAVMGLFLYQLDVRQESLDSPFSREESTVCPLIDWMSREVQGRKAEFAACKDNRGPAAA